MAAVDIINALEYVVAGICILASIENLLALAVFAGSKKLCIKYYTFVVNLALSDAIYALLTIGYPWRPRSSRVLEGFFTGAYTVSFLTILAVAVNRYLALSLMPPARYDSLVTGCRLVGVCVVFWCMGLTYGLVIYNAVPKIVFYVVNFLWYSVAGIILWAIMAVVYVLAFRKIKQYTPPLASTAHAGMSSNSERDQTQVQQTHRLLVMFVLILVTSFVTWAPSCTLKMIAVLKPSLGKDKNYQVWIWASYAFYALSTVINPWIYWWRLEGFREGFYAMFCRCVHKAEPSKFEADPSACETTVAETGF